MSEDRTKELTDARSFEERVLAFFDRVFVELADMRDRQDKLEEKVDRRLQETRPLWEAIMPEIQRLSAAVEELKAATEENKTTLKEVKEAVKRLNTKFEIVVEELYEYRTDVREQRKEILALETRITRLEEANRV